MKSIRMRLLIAALAVLMGTAVSRSQTATDAPPAGPAHFHGHGFGEEHMLGFMADFLNLSDAQRAQMKSIMQKQHGTMKPLFQQSRQIDQQLRQYVEGTFDEAKVQALANQKAQIEAQLTVARTRVHNEMFQALTPEQQAQMKQLEARHAARMQQHMQQAPSGAPEQ